jgi:hypothetical protein
VTADDTDDAVPPEWVPWHALLYWVVWIVRRYYQPELEEVIAKRWMPDVVLALRHEVDNRIEPRLGLWDRGRFVEEIDWLDNYVVEDWSTGVVRHRASRANDPPTFTLAAHWAWLRAAVTRAAMALGQAGPVALPQVLDAKADKAAADTADDPPHTSEAVSKAPLLWVHLDFGEVLQSPIDWPRLPQPTGEPMRAYMDRAIIGDRFFRAVEKRCTQAGLTPQRLGSIRPATYTLGWWEAKYPRRMLEFPWRAAFPQEWLTELRQLREMIYWRLIAELCERLRADEFRAEGQRIDIVVEGRSSVPAVLWRNPDMLLRALSGELCPEPRPMRHRSPGPQLPSFIELMLWPAAAPKKEPQRKQKRATTSRELLKNALVALREDGIDISTRAVHVDDLHKMAAERAGLKLGRSKSTFERALKDAREAGAED